MKFHHVQVRKLGNRGTEVTVDGVPMTLTEDGLLFEQRVNEPPTVTLTLLVDGPISEKFVNHDKHGNQLEIIKPYTGGFDL